MGPVRKMVQAQRCAIVVLPGSIDRPESIISLLQGSGDLIGYESTGAVIVSVNSFRDVVASKEQIETIRKRYFANGEKGTIWLAVVNGKHDSSAPNGRLEPIPGLRPELIQLFSTEQRPLLR